MRVTSSDHGAYYCVVKNDVNITKGYFTLDGLSLFILFDKKSQRANRVTYQLFNTRRKKRIQLV